MIYSLKAISYQLIYRCFQFSNTLKEACAYSFTYLDVPGATGTVAYGINGTGSVAGYYWDGTGVYGFIATTQPGDPTYNTVPEPSTMLLMGTGLAGLVTFRKRLGRIHR